MKLLLLALFLMSKNSFAVGLTDLKVDAKWRVKYNSKEWSYVYIKPLRGVSSNIFEHRKEKIRVILQREAHIDEIADYQKLVENKCKDAGQYYSKKNSGRAEVVTINKKKICYIEFKNAKNEMAHQFVYPELEKNSVANKNYDLYSYAWNSNNKKSKDIVTNFLKGFVQ